MDKELLEIFFSESQELIEALESGLMVLEKNPHDAEQINTIFRAAHSMKGNAGFVGLDHLVEFAHAQENVLDKVRQGQMAVTPGLISVLLESVDLLKGILEAALAGQEPDQPRLKGMEARLLALPEGRTEPVPPPPPQAAPAQPQAPPAQVPPAERGPSLSLVDDRLFRIELNHGPAEDRLGFEVQAQEIKDLLFADHRLYAIWLDPVKDLQAQGRGPNELVAKIKSLGRWLPAEVYLVEAEAEPSQTYHFLFDTIIEDAELVALSLDIAPERITALDPAALEAALAGGTASPAPAAPAVGLEELFPRPQPRVEAAPAPPQPAPPQPKPAAPAPPPPPKPLAEESGRPKEPAKAAAPRPENIRVNLELIDKLMNLAGELVLSRNQLRRMLESQADKQPGLAGLLQTLDLITSDIQEQVMQMRMQPVGNLLNRLPRVVRDLAGQLEKEIELVVEGGEVDLDKSILEGLADPLTHLIRNCADHGLEPPAVREELGKGRAGLIKVRAFHEEGLVNITITDDGRGIDPDKVAAKVVAKGLLLADQAARLTSVEKLNFIFLPGFSTAEKVTDVSGRGVGLDVVKTNVERIGGHLELDSQVGRGTTVRLRLPLTLAIIPSLVVGEGGFSFALPQTEVQELVCVRAKDKIQRLEMVGQAPVLRLRERLLPLVRLSDVLGLDRNFVDPVTGQEKPDRRQRVVDRRTPADEDEGEGPERRQRSVRRDRRRKAAYEDINVVVLRAGANRFGLIVEELFNTEEIVAKPLSRHLQACRCFGGNTIMGDGRVAMILDSTGIAAVAGLRFAEITAEERLRRQREAARRQESAEKHSIVVFTVSPEERFALDLMSLARLERIDPRSIVSLGGREFIQHMGHGLPLLRLDKVLPVRPLPENPPELFIIIPRTQGQSVGILASQIVDALEAEASVVEYKGRQPGITGSAIVEGRLTLFLNARELVDLVDLTQAQAWLKEAEKTWAQGS